MQTWLLDLESFISKRTILLTLTQPGILLFAHELVHIKQGATLAFSILGEVQAYQTQSTLRPFLFSGSINSTWEDDADDVDLSDPFMIRHSLDRWLQLEKDLKWWEGEHSDYGIDPIWPLINNPFPRPSAPTPGIPPHGDPKSLG